MDTINSDVPEYMDARNIAKRFGMSRSLVSKLAYEERLPSYSIRLNGARRGKRLFRVAEVREFMRQHSRGTASR